MLIKLHFHEKIIFTRLNYLRVLKFFLIFLDGVHSLTLKKTTRMTKYDFTFSSSFKS